MLYRQYYLSPIGRLSLVASEESLYGIWLEGQNHFQSGVNEAELVDASNPVLKKTKHWLEAYFKGDNPSPDILPLADRGTDFQQKVWSVLGEIPYGRTISYGQISQQISCKSAQAVGTAVGKNPWLILVPCHRVLLSGGQIGNYAAGEEAKCFLLRLEDIRFDSPREIAYARKKEKNMYTFYEYPKCSTCRKAKAELNQLGLDVESINIKENPPSAQFLKELLVGSDLELKKFFNTSGQSYRSLGLKDKLPTLSLDEAVEFLASDGMLIKRPILIKDGKVLQVGYRTPYQDLNL